MKLNIRSLLLVSALALSLTACGGGKVVVKPAAPAAPVVAAAPATPAPTVVTVVPATPAAPANAEEVAGVRPGSDYVWVPGYYDWRGNRYEWVPGSWVRTPRPATVWVPGRWQPTTGGYLWIPGHWQ